jgi:hypothetical protein
VPIQDFQDEPAIDGAEREALAIRQTSDRFGRAIDSLTRRSSLPQEKSMTDQSFRLAREIEAANMLRDRFKEAFADDVGLIADVLEGETGLFEKMEAVLGTLAEDIELHDGIKLRQESLTERKDRIEKRIELKRALILTAMQAGEIKSRQFAEVTITRSPAPEKPIVTVEADVPSDYFKVPPPVLSKSAINDYYRDRRKALKAAEKVKDPEDRATALRAAHAQFPELPGVTLSNGGETLTVTWK